MHPCLDPPEDSAPPFRLPRSGIECVPLPNDTWEVRLPYEPLLLSSAEMRRLRGILRLE